MNEQLMESISLAIKRAFDSGRKFEHQLIYEAINMCSTGNLHGDYVYLDDLKEHIDELNEKRKAEKVEQ